jgi:hypothetical protein
MRYSTLSTNSSGFLLAMNRPAGLSLTLAISIITTLTERRQIDVDDRGSLDKATVIQALQTSGDADYDSVSQALGGL